MKKYNLALLIPILNKVSSRFDHTLKNEDELYADCGLDSREFIYIIREIEIELKQEIDDEDLLDAQLISVNDLINFMNNIQNKTNVSCI